MATATGTSTAATTPVRAAKSPTAVDGGFAAAQTVGNPWGYSLVGAAATPDGLGILHVLANGIVNSYATTEDLSIRNNKGDARELPLNGPMRGMAMTESGEGYWLVAFDGGVFNYGDAKFFGSMGSTPLNQPVFSIAPSPTDGGYWLVAFDGGIFAFGDAPFLGSTGGIQLRRPIRGITQAASGLGYRMIAADGGVFSYGTADFYGSVVDVDSTITDVIDMALTPSGEGYWVLTRSGRIFEFGDALPMPDLFLENVQGERHIARAFVSNPVDQGLWVYTTPVSDSSALSWWPFRSPPLPLAAWDTLRAECANGNMESCDTLWRSSPFESEYEEFAATCGNRISMPSVEQLGRCVTNPDVP